MTHHSVRPSDPASPIASRDAGFTYIAVVVIASLSTLLVLATVGLMATGNTNLERAADRSTLTLAGSNAMSRILQDLRRSGFTSVGADRYPMTSEVAAGSPVRNQRQIELLIPADADQNGRADIIGATVDWNPDPVRYYVEMGERGLRLMRSGAGRPAETICEHVEQVVFDTPQSSGLAVPLGCVRIQLALRTTRADGTVRQHRIETTVRLRNGERAAS